MNILQIFLVTCFLIIASLYGFVASAASCLLAECKIMGESPVATLYASNIIASPLASPIPNPPDDTKDITAHDFPQFPEEKNTKAIHKNLNEPFDINDINNPLATIKPIEIEKPNPIQAMINHVNNLQLVLNDQVKNELSTPNPAQKTTLIPKEWQSLHLKFTGLPIETQKQIADFYAQKFYQAVWIDKNGSPNPNAQKTHDLLNQEIYFTTPINYDFFPKIPDLKYQNLNTDTILQKDLEFTLNLLPAVNVIHNGVTQLKLFGIPENASIKPYNFQKTLSDLSAGNVDGAIADLTTFNPQYDLLKQEIKRLDALKSNGGYINVPYGKILNQGASDAVIPLIRKRLIQSGFNVPNLDSPVYDAALARQIIAFQISRGIEPEGVINNATYNALKQPISHDLMMLLTNLERIRHTQNMNNYPKYIKVNVPEMTLWVNSGTKNLLSMRTIVGRADRKTPIFNEFLEYIDFNPYWNVPYSLATKDILPKLQKNSNYANTQRIKVFQGEKILNPTGIKWKNYSPKKFPFTLRQEPGKNNALGTVKFMFPNHHAVYLHDTPTKNIFNRYERSESSGCIRVSKPKELASLLLSPKISSATLNQFFASGRNKAIALPNSVPISIYYHTAFFDGNILNIRPDIYGYDQQLFNQLLIELKK